MNNSSIPFRPAAINDNGDFTLTFDTIWIAETDPMKLSIREKGETYRAPGTILSIALNAKYSTNVLY